MASSPPVLWVIAGPNGAGKSTYHQEFVAKNFRAPFVNADLIAFKRWGRHPTNDAEMLEAAQTAAQMRLKLLSQRRSFVAETVFSHDSKLRLMTEAIAGGFIVRLTYISVASASLCALRVRQRVAEGGHDVPLEKLKARYVRSVENARRAVTMAHFAMVLDNTSIREPHRPVLRYEQGVLRAWSNRLPRWTRTFPGLKPERP
jgi:predicted ABC-type ATPase